MHKALGKGLESLLSMSMPDTNDKQQPGESVQVIPVERIRPNRYQPRLKFDESRIKALSD